MSRCWAGVRNALRRSTDSSVGGKWASVERRAPRRQLEPRPQVGRQHVGDLQGEIVERLPHELALHVRRDRARLFVERHDAARVHAGQILGDELELRVHEVQARRVELHVAEDDDLEMRLENVGEEPLVHPGAADGAAGIADHGMEDREPASPGRRQLRALDVAENRRLGAGAQRGDWLHAAPVFIPERQSIEQVFNGDEPGALEIRGSPRADAFQELERGLEEIHGLNER